MDDKAIQLVLGTVLLLAALLGLAWFIWGRRPADEPEAEPLEELETMKVAYPTMPHPDEERFDETPRRPAWMRQRNPQRERRWAEQKQRGEVGR